MNPRETWLINNVKGKTIVNLGFVGHGLPGHRLNQDIQSQNLNSLIIPIDIAHQQVIDLATPNSLVADAANLPLSSSSVDAIIMGELIEHFYHLNHLLSEASRVSRPKAKLFITTPNAYELFLYLKHWLLPPRHSLHTKHNFRGYLADSDHKVFWEPLSLANTLDYYGFAATHISTTNFNFPYIPFLRSLNLPFWPFDRLSGHLCFIATKR